MDHIQIFSLFVDSVSANASNIADDFQKDVAQVFISSAEKLYECYTRKCSVRHIEDNVSIKTHQITNFLQLFTFEFCRMKKEGKMIKQCLNCGRYFIPAKRIDSIYCHAPSKQNPNKTCAEIGPQIKRKERRQSDLKEREHHNITCRLYNMVRRAKEKGDSQELIIFYEKQIDDEMKIHASKRDERKCKEH